MKAFIFLACAGFVAASSATFQVLTFNIAGLPPIINGNGVPGDKATNTRMIGRKMKQGGFDIVNVQEVRVETSCSAELRL